MLYSFIDRGLVNESSAKAHHGFQDEATTAQRVTLRFKANYPHYTISLT